MNWARRMNPPKRLLDVDGWGEFRLHNALTVVSRWIAAILFFVGSAAFAASFSGNARIEVPDSTGGLSWSPAANALTVSCWFKLAVPTDVSLQNDMTILVNRRSGTESDAHGYLVKFNSSQGRIEFSARGSSGIYQNTLIDRPFIERWYHVAVTRQGESFTAYVDGRQVFAGSGSVGDANSTDGLSVGGWGDGKYLYGEVQEVAIHQDALSQDFIVGNMLTTQPAIGSLKGYFKLGFSTNSVDNLKNFAPDPQPTGTGAAVAAGSGKVEFEEANQIGEQSAFDSKRNGGRDAMAPLSGSFSWEQIVLARPTPGITFDLRIGYSSGNSFGGFKLGSTDPYASGPLGSGWRHTFETKVLPAQANGFSPLADVDTIGLMMWNGAIETWDLDQGTGEYKTRSREYRGEFSFLGTTNCQWVTPERLVYVFKSPNSGAAVMRGRLLSIRDFNSNAVQIVWDETIGRITNVLDSARGRYEFKYQGGLLTNVTFQNWSVVFSYDVMNRLVSKHVTNTSGIYTNTPTTWQFAYNTTNLVERIIDPNGGTNTVQYDQYGRRMAQADAIGRTNQTRYGVPGKRQITHIDPGNFQWVETFDRKHRLLSQADPLNQATRYTYDDAGNRTSIVEPLGHTTFFGYDSRANVIARSNALGEVTRWVMHSFFNKAIQEINPFNWTNYFDITNTTGNLLRHFDDLGTLVTYGYSTNGLVLTSADGNNRTNRFTYDTNGFVIMKVDAAGLTNRIGNNEVGWKLAETNALNQVSSVAYDLNGKVVRAVDPLGRVFTKTYDANGNVLTESDAKGQLTRHAYDLADQKTNVVDRAGFTNSFTYTARGKLERMIDPNGSSTTNFYDNANRLFSVSDALGNTVTNVFDANGNKTEMVDQLGRRWKTTYDRLNRAVTQADPFGNRKQTSFDPAGRVSTITTPNGFPSTHAYDGRGRLTNWVDAESFVWRYQYDGVGSITNIVDALNGNYTMTYGPRNERLTERNQDNKLWTYVYDPLLRLQQQTDANGTTRTLNYDPGGRVLAVTFNTGRVNSFSYDDNNNPEVLSRSGSGPPTLSQLRYDAMDRVVEYTDAFSKKVRYTYDRLGRVDSTTYPGGKVLTNSFDAISRLTNQVFNGQHTASFQYDKAGRLVSRSYPNGIVQTNGFDEAGRLTALSYLTNTTGAMLAYTYAYDRNGNKTASTEKGTLNWLMPSLTDEASRFTPGGRLMDRQITPTNGVTAAITYQYDASGNMTNAVGNGQSWRLAYDEDNRVTSLAWDCGITARNITNRYDAFGRRIAKTVDGVESRFVLDLSAKMERVLCDVDAAGAVAAWYVHGPDLSFKVDATNGLTCYHADAMANIVATTDGSMATVYQYAYTPYGRSLGETNCSTNRVIGLVQNPYRFVGSQGVIEDLPDLYFMRARYYLAEAGVFLSTDPVKSIGSGWKPNAYGYAGLNPLRSVDPDGNSFWQISFNPNGDGFRAHGNYGGPEWSAGQYQEFSSFNEFVSASRKALPQDGEDWDYWEHDAWFQLAEDAGGIDGYILRTYANGQLGAKLLSRSAKSVLARDFDDGARQLATAGVFLGLQQPIAIGMSITGVSKTQQSQIQGTPSAGTEATPLPERYASAAAYAESQNVNYAKSSKEIQTIYDRAQTARNNVIESAAKGKPANMSQGAWMDSMVKQMNKDLGLKTTKKKKR